MKEKWVFPQTEVQQFMANEYVAACENSSGTIYKFVCDAGAGQQEKDGRYYTSNIWQVVADDGTILAGTGSRGKSRFAACEATHEADTTDDFITGYMVNEFNKKAPVIPVIIWTHRGNVHCTTNLVMDSWEITRS